MLTGAIALTVDKVATYLWIWDQGLQHLVQLLVKGSISACVCTSTCAKRSTLIYEKKFFLGWAHPEVFKLASQQA